MVRTTTEADDDRTAAEVTDVAADQYARVPTHENFAALRGAVADEDGVTSFGRETSLTAVGWAIVEAAESLEYDVASMIDFDDRDRVTVEWSPDDVEYDGVPTDLAGLVAAADANAGDRDVVFKPDARDFKAEVFVERGVAPHRDE
jgi:hypothetical protein